MSMPGFAREWMAQWRAAASELAEQHARELRELTGEQARAAAESLLELGASLPLAPDRERTSGLVVQQALFHGRRPTA
jgi:hypothetical protein